MGAILSVCGLGQLACCAGSTACSMFSCCGMANSARLMYSIMLFLITMVGWIMVVPSVSTWMKSWIPFCWNAPKITWTDKFGAMLNETKVVPEEWMRMFTETKNGTSKTICDDFTGYQAVYRLMFATTIFFIVFAAIMIRVRSSRDPRAVLHNGMWPIKFLLLLGGIVGAFFIPSSDGFTETWKVFGFIGSFLFLVIQFYFIIDFADNWASGWVHEMEDGSTQHYYFLLLTSLGNMALGLTGIVLLYVYYTAEGCGLHKFVVSFNLILCFILTVMSILPKIQEYNEASGLLQASLVTLYMVYLTWSSLNSSPYNECRTEWSSSKDTNLSRESFISLLICFACVLYSSFRLSSHFLASTGVSNLTAEEGGSDGTGEDDEEEMGSWSYFYLILAMGTLYLMMTLTNWYSPTEAYQHFGQSTSSLWMKVISSWLCASLYIWSLVAPIVLGDCRDFSRN